MISAGFHCCTRVAEHHHHRHHQCGASQQPLVSGQEGRNLAGTETNQAHVHLRLDRPALDPPTPTPTPTPTSLSMGMDPAGETPRVSSISMGIIWSICLAWQAALQDLLRALTECNHVFFFFSLFLLSFFNIVCILCIIAFGASSFYSFLYQKCTTFFIIFWIIGMVFVSEERKKVSCESIEKTHIAHCFSY